MSSDPRHLDPKRRKKQQVGRKGHKALQRKLAPLRDVKAFLNATNDPEVHLGHGRLPRNLITAFLNAINDPDVQRLLRNLDQVDPGKKKQKAGRKGQKALRRKLAPLGNATAFLSAINDPNADQRLRHLAGVVVEENESRQTDGVLLELQLRGDPATRPSAPRSPKAIAKLLDERAGEEWTVKGRLRYVARDLPPHLMKLILTVHESLLRRLRRCAFPGCSLFIVDATSTGTKRFCEDKHRTYNSRRPETASERRELTQLKSDLAQLSRGRRRTSK